MKERLLFGCSLVSTIGLLFLLLWLVPEQITARPLAMAQDEPPQSVTLEIGYQITFREVTTQSDGTSTWVYLVEALPKAKKLQKWVLALPDCTTIMTASPELWEAVYPDPNTGIHGIKWEKEGRELQEGDFTVTLTGRWAIGTVQVAAKGPTVAHGLLAGPVCEADLPPVPPAPPATATATSTIIPTAPATPTATATATAPVPPSPTATATRSPTPTRPASPSELLLQVNKIDYLWIDADEDDGVSTGDTLLYVIKLVNSGNTRVTDLLVRDSLSPATTLLAGAMQTDHGIVVSGNQVDDREVLIEIEALDPGASATISFQVQISSQITVAQIENQAVITFRDPAHQNGELFSTVSDDPDTSERLDPTVTPLTGGAQAIYLPLIQR